MASKNALIQVPALARWYPSVSATQAAILERLKPEPSEMLHPDRYGRLEGLTHVYAPKVDPAFYYFKDGKVAVIVIHDVRVMATLSEAAMVAILGSPTAARQLASCIDKQATHLAYPEHGIAFSVWDDEVVAVELFTPRSMDAYRAEIYLEPGPQPL